MTAWPQARPIRLGSVAGILMALVVLMGAAGCDSSHPASSTQLSDQALLATGAQLAVLVIPPPIGYSLDPAKDANGTISPGVFDRFGGIQPSQAQHFLAGYKRNYVNYSSQEGIAITLLKFSSSQSAEAYLRSTATKTLSFDAPTYQPFRQIPGATMVSGTKAFGGAYSYGVVMARGEIYASVVYENAAAGPPPFELASWAKVQYNRLGLAKK